MIHGGKALEAALDIVQEFSHGEIPSMPVPGDKAYANAWQVNIEAAEEANDPGRFTAFIGYEWTSNTGGNNLHRNVIYHDGGDKASQMVPHTVKEPLGSDNPADLWQWMASYEKNTGGKLLAIAHNGNLSNGTRYLPTVHLRQWELAQTSSIDAMSRAGRKQSGGSGHAFLHSLEYDPRCADHKG